MVVNEKLKFVWSSLPKTGTLSMVAFLKKQFNSRRYSYNHIAVVPVQYKTYFKFVLVRNPYHRLFSYWKWCVLMKKDPRKDRPQDTFEEFLEHMINCQHESAHKHVYYWINQSQFVDLFKPDMILKLETIATDISKLPFVRKDQIFPYRRNRSVKVVHEFTPREIELMNKHSVEDCGRFKYVQL